MPRRVPSFIFLDAHRQGYWRGDSLCKLCTLCAGQGFGPGEDIFQSSNSMDIYAFFDVAGHTSGRSDGLGVHVCLGRGKASVA